MPKLTNGQFFNVRRHLDLHNGTVMLHSWIGRKQIRFYRMKLFLRIYQFQFKVLNTLQHITVAGLAEVLEVLALFLSK